jgi:hypothetical protein
MGKGEMKMSKIDDYNKIRNQNEHDIGNLQEVLKNHRDGTPNPHNDKGYMAFHDHAVWDSDMKVFIHASYGYYGSSSVYDVGGENIKKYLLKVLNSKGEEIIKEAIELMRKDIETAKKACVDEAKAILTEVTEC